MINKNSKILFFGCGKMGSAILQNFLDKNINPQNITIIDPLIQTKIPEINYYPKISEISSKYQADLVIFAFKPQSAADILPEIIKYNIFHKNSIFISILAGKKLQFFAEFLGQKAKIIRIMPNLPMAIGEGISAFITNHNLSQSESNSVMDLWSKNIELQIESEIDIFTAIAGSGPAYLFLFAQNLINIAKESGFNEDSATKMVTQMFYGSSKMLLDNNLDIAELIKSVTSKGGTTAAGLEQFESGNFKDLLKKVTYAAQKRSEELS
jgi:pyrroline-5-carboxylate reductase